MNAEAPKMNPALPEREIANFAIDSRDVKAGDVLFALSQPDYKNNGFNGEFDDATQFVLVRVVVHTPLFVGQAEMLLHRFCRHLPGQRLVSSDR